MFGIPTWLWLVILVIAFYILPMIAARTFRKRVRTELIAFLREKFPGIKVLEETEKSLELQIDPETTGRLNLQNIYPAIAALRPHTPESRRAVFAKFTEVLTDPKAYEHVSLATHGDSILPRLVDTEFLNAVSEKSELPHRPLGFTGLNIAYVFDSENHVAYITRANAEELGLDDRELHDHALANLRKIFDPNILTSVRSPESAMSLIDSGDGHDSARLLLIPEHLQNGEVLAAVLPSRDTLLLAPAPANNDWSTLNGLAGATEEALTDRALRITHLTVEPAPADPANE